MTFEDLWKLTRRYWLILVASLLVGIALAGAYMVTRTPVYTATTSAYVVPIDGGEEAASTGSAYSGSLLAQQKAKAWVPLIKSTGTAEATIDRLRLDMSPEALAGTISAELADDTPLITVSATSDSPRDAQRIADGVVVSAAGEAKRLEGKQSGVEIKSVQNAQLPTKPSSPRPERILPVGAIAGLVIGYLIAVIRMRRDTRVRNPEDVEKHIGASVLAIVPATKDLESRNRQARGESNFATREALRQLRTNLRFVDVDHSPRTIVVTSARMSEGKSTIAANLARVLAASGQRVLLIDADLRRPTMADVFDLDSDVGLTQVLAGSVSFDDAYQEVAPNLRALTAGQIPPNPSELLGSDRMHQLLCSVRDTYMVVLDAPPLLPVTDAALLTARADGALLVVSAASTRQEHLQRAVANLERVGGHVLGAVLNQVNTKRINRIVYGDTQYGYGAYGTYGNGEYVADEQGSASDEGATKAGSPARRWFQRASNGSKSQYGERSRFRQSRNARAGR